MLIEKQEAAFFYSSISVSTRHALNLDIVKNTQPL